MRTLSEEQKYPVWKLCKFLHITRSAYYRWLKQPKSERELENERIAGEIVKIHEAHPSMGYRRIRDELDRNRGIYVNDKRVLRINRAINIQSKIKFRRRGCTISSKSPEHIAKNYLNRQFHADAPNMKWLTDVTEFKYILNENGIYETRKVYLSAILDLYDRRIVSYVLSNHNDSKLAFDTFDAAVAAAPNARPLFHSDRGSPYTSRVFHLKLKKCGMKQSMSRVARCLDNGPMEGFWGIIKREMYYGYKFHGRDQLVNSISDYIHYYNHHRIQRRLSVMTPMEFHKCYIDTTLNKMAPAA